MKRWANIAIIVGMLNFGAFVIGTFVVGGDAVNVGQSCPPGNYLWDKRLTNPCYEVSRGVYIYSKAHVYSIFLSWPLVMAGTLYLSYVKAAEKADHGLGPHP